VKLECSQVHWLTAIIPAIGETEIKRIVVGGWPGLKVRDPISINSWTWWYMPVIPAT
jgi:hypothetical protein